MAKTNTTPAATASHDEEQQLNSRLQQCPIAIIGMASVFADAKNLEQYWDNIAESVDAIMDVPASRWAIDDHYDSDPKAEDKTYCKRGGFIPELDFDPMEFGLPPNIMELTDIAQLLSLVVARDVLNDAGIGDGSDYDRDKVGITLGVGGGQKQITPLTSRLQGPVLDKVLKASGIDEEDRGMIIDKFKKAYIGWEENSFPGMLGNVISGRIANRFDLGGMNCVVDAACAGSLAAIKLAISDLLEYRSEVMISGGVCCDNSPFMYMSFSKTPAFTTNQDIRPFDNDSKGMMIGEGIGMLAFKRLADAERDGDKIYAVLKGIGTSSDGRFKSIYAPRPDGQAKALNRAYNDAGFDPTTCGLIEAHGTGTKAGDAAEFAGLVKHFSHNNDQKQHIALGSVKSQIGHTKAAAGSAGMIKAVLALHHKVLPPTIHIDQPNQSLDIENTPLYLNSETRPWLPRADGTARRAGVSSFGFGGTNFHMVLEEYQPQQQGAYRLNAVPQSILITGTNEQSIVAELNSQRAKLDVDGDAQEYAFNALVNDWSLTTPANDVARCGFIAKNAVEAIKMIDSALKKFKAKAGDISWTVPSGVYYRLSGLQTKGKVVALFSGQGSQYTNMGRELACNFPTILNATAQMDQSFTGAGLNQLSSVTYPIPVFSKEAREEQEAVLRLTQNAQPAIGTFSLGLYRTFEQAGFKADFTAGHSFGELTALWAAGVYNDEDYMFLARSRGQAMTSPEGGADAGSMVAVVGQAAKVAEDIKDIKDVEIANYNSNNQVVIAGVTSQVLVAMDELHDKGYKVVRLPVSAAFHTPLVGHAQKPFAAAIDSVTFNSPKVPVFANGTAKAYNTKPTEIKKQLKNHILESVHFNQQVENLYAQGGRIFIEFGPKHVLTKLVENILQDKDDVVAIAVNGSPKKSADAQMRQAALQMAVLGLELGNIDPYSALKLPTAPRKMSPLAMKLSGAAYVSDKTQKQFTDALTDGWTVKQATATASEPQVKVVEKIVEVETIVEKIVEVEKIVYVDRPVSGSAAPVANSATASNSAELVSSIERSVGQFVEHQQQLLNVHEQYMQGPQDYAKTFQSVLEAQPGATELPESIDRTLGMYHDFQSETLRVHEKYLSNQTDNMSAMLNNTAASAPKGQVIDVAAQTVAEPAVATSTVASVAPVVQKAPVKPIAPVAQPVVASVQTTATAIDMTPPVVAPVTPVAAPAAALNVEKIQSVMLDVVADKTGYPAEMLELEMDMEADLGIDSIKRVEILGSVQELIPTLPELNPEDLAELRTLGQIVDYMQSKVPPVSVNSGAPVLHVVESSPTLAPAGPVINLAKIQAVMMDVVAEKTGYPAEMLELEMDMEADLGIDSIKRVEILGAVQETIPDLPELNPEDLAELRTLGEIVSHMEEKAQSKVPASAPTPAPVALHVVESTPAVAIATIDLAHIQSVMMNVVAEKTGYPSDMLELEMDMEADLGIDSIKRVEILGAVQETIPDLPELNPEDLAELRTLGEIVTYMQSKVPAASVGVVAAPATIDLAHIQSVMMSVVAEKTGYPADMLELEMDMEADLGIDSIKRVEILGAVQETIPDLPELNPEDLAELRTLGEIVSHMQSKVQSKVSATPVAAAPAPVVAPIAVEAVSASVSADEFTTNLMAVVADKTGYPAEMLELEMDMEADLGIDSIKRVEILGAVQDSMPGLPEVDPETLAEMRTLAEIVSSFTAQPGNSVAFEPAPSQIVAIKRLASVNKITQDANGANALIVDDGTGSAVALAANMSKAGWNITAIKPAWVNGSSKKSFAKTVNVVELADVDEQAIKDICTKVQLDAVIYLQPKSTLAGVEYPQTSKQGLMLAFLLAKLCNVKAASSSQNARASFMVVTRQGGSLGIDGASPTDTDLVQGGLNGLVKTLSHEWSNVFCRAVDVADKLAADKVAAIVSDELLDADTALVEVASDKTGRLTLVGEQTDSYALTAGNSIDSNSVFLVSGGAKGVTAHCVIRLAKQYQAKFILLGRSVFDDNEPAWAVGINDEAALKKAAMQALIASGEKPTPVKIVKFIKPVLANREIAQTLAAIKTVGAQVHYVAADVTDSNSVQAAVKPAIAEFGAITGIIHGAGVLADKFIEQKTLADFESVYRTKIDGLVSLLACTDIANVKHLVLFSSGAGFYGNPGQSDYSIANEILNKTAYRFKALHPQAQVLSFNWGPWDGGMVTPELKRMFAERGAYIIPLDSGAELLLSELAATDNRSPQILVGNDLASEQEGTPVKKLQASRLIKSFQATNHAFLADHVIGDNQVLPTVCAIQWMADAALAIYPGYHYQGLEQYKLFKGVVFDGVAFDGSEANDFTIDLSLLVDDGDVLRIGAKVSSLNDKGKPVFHYGAELLLARKPLSSETVTTDLPALSAVNSAANLYSDGTLFHGERLQGITEVIRCDEQGLLLGCQIPSMVAAQGEFGPGIVANDLVYQAMLVWVRRQLGLGSLPAATLGWRLYRDPQAGEAFYLQLDVVKQTSNTLVADIALIDTNKQLLAQVKSAEVTGSESLNSLFKSKTQ
ncbi:MAG: acyl transferase domain-containing protein [Phenylobacterium sp.]|jgi:acyl transferase domain-containing protein